jgi:hypothetical protein
MLPLVFSTFFACTGTPADDTAGDTAPVVLTGPGTLAFSFRMDDDYIATMEEDGETPLGTFGGSIYAEDDGTSIGPNDGAVPLLDFSVPGVDLTVDGGPSAVLSVTEPLEPQIVWVLGCLDVAEDGCGDPGDPITVPNENKVQVAAGTETPFEVYLGMLRP